MATKKPFPFEMSRRDKEVPGKGKEGSKKEEAFDKFQAKRFAKGGGVESRGKTKGKMVTMKRGGKC